jgi:hypothetical protein
MPVRRLAAAACVTAALVALTGCQQPTPRVTVRADRSVVSVDAERWCKDNKVPADGQCPTRSAEVPVLKVAPGARVTIDVPRAVAAEGWLVAINGQQVSNLQRDHFVAVSTDQLGQAGTGQLQVVRVKPDGDKLTPTAAWRVVLAQQS